MIDVLRVRRGFATNSSSTHSIILAGTGDLDRIPAHKKQFGWDFFLQSTREQKKDYMVAQLFQVLTTSMGEEIAAAVVAGVFGETATEESCYVDHQSIISCPQSYSNEYPCLMFFKELSEALLNDETVAFAGGNDNADDGGEGSVDVGIPHARFNFISFLREQGKNLVTHKDNNGVWTVFNRSTGMKIHLKFTDQDIVKGQYKPVYPELLDVKITDYCPFGCTWCYQDSTTKGSHAAMQDLYTLSYVAHSYGVFEIALGGGEPTLHPDFQTIVTAFSGPGCIVNFTTKNRGIYSDPDLFRFCYENCGGWAFSVTNEEEVRSVLKAHKESERVFRASRSDHLKPYRRDNVLSFQYIPGAYSLENFEKVLAAVPCNYTLTLLGYKSVGRGGDEPHKRLPWLAAVEKQRYRPAIAIDTKMANDYKEGLEKHGIDHRLFYLEEGVYSMYFDLVSSSYGKSSYDGLLIKYQNINDPFSSFRSWNGHPPAK